MAPQGYGRGENLRLPAQMPGKSWQVRRGREDQTDVSEWTQPGSPGVFVVRVMREGPGPNPADFRRMAEQGGNPACLTETSDTLDESAAGGTPRLLWLKTCSTRDAKHLANLLLYLRGADAHYLLIRRWGAAPQDAELRQWEDYLRSVALCDTRSGHGAPCPLAGTVTP
jgi:hypothetical protein